MIAPVNHSLTADAVVTRHNLLVVDDEIEIVKSLRRQFRREYTVYTANSADEGYQIMTQVPIHAIISDQRMPNMSGAEFFSQIRNEYPDAIRLLLTGYADIQAVITAINDGNVFRYITKPWDPVELDTIVSEALVRHDLIIRNRQLVQELQESNEMLELRVVQRTEELSQVNEQLRLLNTQKDKFMGMVAHDLRGPLGNLHMCTRLLRKSQKTGAEAEAFLGIIDEVSSKMLHLVNDLLDINAIESGHLVLEPQTVDVRAFIERVGHLNSYSATSKDITLAIDMDESITTARFDPKRMEQVLDNLIGNAIKFSFRETTVRLTAQQDADFLLFTVIDQGQGIQAHELPKLFGAFQRTSTVPTAGEHSTGLGLSICKRIVDLHGGSIEVASEFGLGTTFTVRLPII